MNATEGHAAGLEAEMRKTLAAAWKVGLNVAYMFTRVKLKEQTRHTLDLNARYDLNPHWMLKLRAKNLLNSTVRFKQEVAETGKEEEVERYKTHAAFEVGVTYTF